MTEIDWLARGEKLEEQLSRLETRMSVLRIRMGEQDCEPERIPLLRHLRMAQLLRCDANKCHMVLSVNDALLVINTAGLTGNL